jgi:hypothetical protein
MKVQTEQIAATRASLASRAITEIKEQVQLDRWQKQIEERQMAGLSIAAFCEQRGISKTTYYYRLRKVREHLCRSSGLLPELPSEAPNEQRVVPIRTVTENTRESRVEIVSGDLRISFEGEPNPAALKAVIEALRSC